MTTLRGAEVTVDARRVARAAMGIAFLGMSVLVVVLFVAGIEKNAEINQLRQHGVPVEITVSGCRGLLGGSGSNAAGYSCQGTFTLKGRTYDEAIPGNTLHNPGDKLPAVADPGNPSWVATDSVLSTEHASAGVLLVPAILLAVLVLLAGGVALRWRRATSPLRPETGQWRREVAAGV